MSKNIRLGFVGAGQNTRRKHLPGFQQLAGVELAGVCNARDESTQRVAREFGISQTYGTWQDLVADERIDAVVIGTWPNLHCEVTCAALAAGKHVLTEARMARDLVEARQMLAAQAAHPELTAMVVPSPFGLQHGAYLRSIIDHGFLGDLREVVVLGANDAFWDCSQFLHPRQCQKVSGLNVLSLGILHETVSRWIPATTQVFAQSRIFEPNRPLEDLAIQGQVTVPDSLQVLTHLAGGAQGLYHFSGIALFGPGLQIHLYGSEGTIKVQFDPRDDSRELVLTGRHGDAELRPLKLPEERLGGWRVEADFIDAIRGEKQVTLNSFETACEYMEFTQAVHESSKRNAAVSLPL
ncbi:MAG: Gfo/Idh/MocA family oxidoreductase [Planctomycetaceae bacterium]|nr:Gfo/Idh/MocA family oxidoreductase [Planctomycetaceae bacterium]